MRMERIFLGVLFFSGWTMASSLLHQYHYVADPVSWTEAQTYCRKTHTDLATIDNNEELNRLISTVSSFGNGSDIWIGLYSNITWQWSDGHNMSHVERMNLDKNNHGFARCVIPQSGFANWRYSGCSDTRRSVCYNGTQQVPKFVPDPGLKTWPDAQKHCREKYRDLATLRNETEYKESRKVVEKEWWPWNGLFGVTKSYWSDESGSSFRYWDNTQHPVLRIHLACGIVALNKSGKWRFLQCETRLPFVCYSVPPPPGPVMRRVVRVRINRGGSSVDLNDPAVKEQILKQLQDRLTEEGVSGVTLKWREQPDGKVFHKEGGSSPKKKRVKTECKTEL